MRYVCTITRSGGQARITLPKKFIENRGFENHNFIVIDDRENDLAVIKGVDFEEDTDSKRKSGTGGSYRRAKRGDKARN